MKAWSLRAMACALDFLGYTFDQKNGNWKDIDPRIALADPAVVVRDVAELKKRCDVVIVSMHNGIEYQPKPSEAQITFAHAAIDAGAKLVIGHHPHVVQPSEKLPQRNDLLFAGQLRVRPIPTRSHATWGSSGEFLFWARRSSTRAR